MERNLVLVILLWAVVYKTAAQPAAPTNVVIFSGDKSVILHWDADGSPNVTGYSVSRSTSSAGPFTQQNKSLLTPLGYCDISVSDGTAYYYQVTAVNSLSQTSSPSITVSTIPNPFPSDDAFMDYIEEAHFDFYWYTANPANGLIPDRSVGGAPGGSAASIFSVGLGLTAIGVAIDHGWITRNQGAARVLTTLNTLWNGPQGTNDAGDIGYQGWFYHYLDMNAATRSGSSELSSIDSTFLLAGVLYAKQYFNGTNATETSIQTLATSIFNRVNWAWFAPDTNSVRMGWLPESGFTGYGDWQGYNEGKLLYLLGMGASSNTLPAACWSFWTSGYNWATTFGESYVVFAPMYGHEYSECWVDFRHVGDAYMNAENSTYFENSRRAALAQQAYCIANPGGFRGYSAQFWGLTASDDPTNGYAVHGAPLNTPDAFDNGTLAPTAAGGAMSFAPDIALPTLEGIYSQGRTKVWTAFGFIDAFSFNANWYDTDELGIDQGPILVSTENYRNQNVWRLFMRNPEIQRGLQQAGFLALPFVGLANPTFNAESNTVTVTWAATAGRTYQVEYSTNLLYWFTSPTGEVTATNSIASWTDSGPPATLTPPFGVRQRFYRVFQYGSP